MKKKNYEDPSIITERFITEDVLCTSAADPHFIKDGKLEAGKSNYSPEGFKVVL